MNIRDVVDALRPLAKQGAAAVKLVDALTALGSLETQETELRKRVDELLIAASTAETHVAKAEAQAVSVCSAAKERAALAVAEASKRASDIIQDARVSAQNLISEAEIRASGLATLAGNLGEKVAGLNSDIARLEERKSALTADITKLRDKFLG